MPTLDLSELNIVASVLGGFAMLYGLAAVQIKSRLFLGEALPAVLVGAVLGPAAARLLDVRRWVAATTRQDDVTMGVMRIMIGIQLVIAGYQLPARYLRSRWREMVVCLGPVMALMWLATSACVLAALPGVGALPALIVGACVTSTDPILSQAIAKGPFADKFVARALREVISAEAGANDGFASPFLGLALTLLLQRRPAADPADDAAAPDVARALGAWLLETLLYTVLLALAYGALAGYLARRAVGLSLARKWIDSESYLLFPCSLGLFVLGTCGALGTSDLLACFTAGCALNWDGRFLAETQRRHDDFNSCIDVLLNLAGFAYIGVTAPWAAFAPDGDGAGGVATGPRLLALGLLVLVFRRVPALLACYRLMPAVVPGWRDAVFMGYFGPIGVGAIYYLEHTRLLLLRLPHRTDAEERLLQTVGPVVYFLALFSILVHGLSIPVLNTAYWLYGVRPLMGDAETIRRRSVHVALPPNAIRAADDTFIAFNRFPRPSVAAADASALPTFHPSGYAAGKENSGSGGGSGGGGGGGGGDGGISSSSSLRSIVVDVAEKGNERDDRKMDS